MLNKIKLNYLIRKNELFKQSIKSFVVKLKSYESVKITPDEPVPNDHKVNEFGRVLFLFL